MTTIPSGSKLIAPARFTIVGDRQTGKTHAALLYAVNEANAGQRVIIEVRYPNGELHEAQTLIKQLDLDTTRISTHHSKCGISFASGGYISFVELGHIKRDALKNQYDVQIIDSDHPEDSSNERTIIGVKRFIAVVTTLGTDHIMDPATNRKMMLLGEAASAVGQCTALLGADTTNDMLRLINEAQERIQSTPAPHIFTVDGTDYPDTPTP